MSRRPQPQNPREQGDVPIHKRTPSLQGIHNSDKALYMFGVTAEEFQRHKALARLGANEPVYQESLRVIRHHPLENRCDLDEYDEAIILSSDRRRPSVWKLRSMLGKDYSNSYKAHQRLGTSPSEVLEKRSRELASLDPQLYHENQYDTAGSSESSAPNSASPPPIGASTSIRRGRSSHRRAKSQSSLYRFIRRARPDRDSTMSPPPTMHSRSPSPNSIFSKMLSTEVGKHGHNMTHVELVDMWNEIALCRDRGLSLENCVQHVFEVFPHVFMEDPSSTRTMTTSPNTETAEAIVMGQLDEKEREVDCLLEEKTDEIQTTRSLLRNSSVASPESTTTPSSSSSSNRTVFISLLKCNLVCSSIEYGKHFLSDVSEFVDNPSRHFHEMSTFLFALRTGYFISGFDGNSMDESSPFFCNNIVDFFLFFGPTIRRYNSNSTALHMAVSCVFDEIEDKNAPYTKWSDKLKKSVFIVCYLLHIGYYWKDKNPHGGPSPVKMLQNHAPRVFKHVCLFHKYLGKQIYMTEFQAICESLPTFFDIHIAKMIGQFTFHNHSFTHKQDTFGGNDMRRELTSIPPEHMTVISDFHEMNTRVTRLSHFYDVVL